MTADDSVDAAIARAERDLVDFERVGVPLWLIDRFTLAVEVKKLRAELAQLRKRADAAD